MATNCSFITATEARNIARNDSLIWTEICEVQTQLLAAIDANTFSIIVNDATPMTSIQGILTATVTAGGTGYNPVVTTASIGGGTTGINGAVTPEVAVNGTVITGFTVTNPGTITVLSATVAAGGSGYSLNDVLTIPDLDPVPGTAATVTVTSLSTIRLQNETDYAVSFAGGATYAVNDVITMSDGSTVTVTSINAGAVDGFSITSTTTTGITVENDTLTQSSVFRVGGGGGTGFTLTLVDANQAPFVVSVTTPGAYNLLPVNPVATTNGTGTGATLTAVTSSYAPVNVSAVVGAPSELIDAQDETNYDNSAGNGIFAVGSQYRATETILLNDGHTAIVDTIGASTGVVLTALQNETNFGGRFAGGANYTTGNTITMSDGSVITIDTVVTGAITEFTVTTSSTAQFAPGATLIQISSTSTGIGFTLTSAAANEILVGPVATFTLDTVVSTPFFFPTTVIQTSSSPDGGDPAGTVAIGTGFILTPASNNINLLAGGLNAVLTPIEVNGAITDVIINVPGSGYLVGAPILFPTPAAGAGATAFVNAIGSGGTITSISITNGGSGYQQAVATVTVTAPGGLTPALAFVGTVTTNGGFITGISIQEGGSGYAELLPTVDITDSDGGSGAVLTTAIAGGAVTAINIVNAGSGFTAPTLTIVAAPTSAGAGATATATVGTNTFGTTPSDFNDVLTGQATNAVILDQITFVSDYFTSLGYNIRAQTNSDTTNTMQWQIIW